MAAAGDTVTYITGAPLQALPPAVHGMPVPLSEYMHRVRFIYLPSIESVLNYLASLHITTSGGRHPDAILLDAPAPAPSATSGRSPAAASGRSLAAVGRMRAALEEAALTVSAVSAGGRCAALMVSEPAGGRPGRPPDRHTVQLVNAAPGTVQLNCGTLSCLLTATQHCLLPRHVSVSA